MPRLNEKAELEKLTTKELQTYLRCLCMAEKCAVLIDGGKVKRHKKIVKEILEARHENSSSAP